MSGTNNSERKVMSFISKLFKPWSSDQSDLSADFSTSDSVTNDRNQKRYNITEVSVGENNCPNTPLINSEHDIADFIPSGPSREATKEKINESLETQTNEVKQTRLKGLQNNESSFSTPKRMGKIRLTGFDRLLKELSSSKINKDNMIESKRSKNESNLSRSAKSIKLRGFGQLEEDLSTPKKGQLNSTGFKHNTKEPSSQKTPIKLRGFEQLKEKLNSPEKIIINRETNFLSSLRSVLSEKSSGLRETSQSESKISTNNSYNITSSLDESLTIIDTQVLDSLIQDKLNDLNEKAEIASSKDNEVVRIEVGDTIDKGVQNASNQPRQDISLINEEVKDLGEDIAQEKIIMQTEGVLDSENPVQEDHQNQKIQEINNINTNNNNVEDIIQKEANKSNDVIISESAHNVQLDDQSQHDPVQEIQEIQSNNTNNVNSVIIRRTEVNLSDGLKSSKKPDNFQGANQNSQIQENSKEVPIQEVISKKNHNTPSKDIENVQRNNSQVGKQSQQILKSDNINSYYKERESVRQKEISRKNLNTLSKVTENVPSINAQVVQQSQRTLGPYNPNLYNEGISEQEEVRDKNHITPSEIIENIPRRKPQVSKQSQSLPEPENINSYRKEGSIREEVNQKNPSTPNRAIESIPRSNNQVDKQRQQILKPDNLNSYRKEASIQEEVIEKNLITPGKSFENVPRSNAQVDQQSQRIPIPYNPSSYNKELDNNRKMDANKSDATIGESIQHSPRGNIQVDKQIQQILEPAIINSFNKEVENIRQREVNKNIITSGKIIGNASRGNAQVDKQHQNILKPDNININAYNKEMESQKEANKREVILDKTVETVPRRNPQASQYISSPYNLNSYSKEVENNLQKEVNGKNLFTPSKVIENVPRSHAQIDKQTQNLPDPNSYNKEVEIIKRKEANKINFTSSKVIENVRRSNIQIDKHRQQEPDSVNSHINKVLIREDNRNNDNIIPSKIIGSAPSRNEQVDKLCQQILRPDNIDSNSKEVENNRRKEVSGKDLITQSIIAGNVPRSNAPVYKQTQHIPEPYNLNSYNKEVSIQDGVIGENLLTPSEAIENVQRSNTQVDKQRQQILKPASLNSYNKEMENIRQREANKNIITPSKIIENVPRGNTQVDNQRQQILKPDNLNSYSKEVSIREEVNKKILSTPNKAIENVPRDNSQVDKQSQKILKPDTLNPYEKEKESVRQKEVNTRGVTLGKTTDNAQGLTESQKDGNTYNVVDITRQQELNERYNVLLSKIPSKMQDHHQSQKSQETLNNNSHNNKVDRASQQETNKGNHMRLSNIADRVQNHNESQQEVNLYDKDKAISRLEADVISTKISPKIQNHSQSQSQSQKVQKTHDINSNIHEVENTALKEAKNRVELRPRERQQIQKSNLFNKVDNFSRLDQSNENNDVVLNVESVPRSRSVAQEKDNGNSDMVSSVDSAIDNRKIVQNFSHSKKIQEVHNINPSSKKGNISTLNEKSADILSAEEAIRSQKHSDINQKSQEIRPTISIQEVEILRSEKENKRNDVDDGIVVDSAKTLILDIQRPPSNEVQNSTLNEKRVEPSGANALLNSSRNSPLVKKLHSQNADSPLFVPEESDEDTIGSLENRKLIFHGDKSVDINKSITKVNEDLIHKTNKGNVSSPTRKRNLVEDDINMDLSTILPEVKSKSKKNEHTERKEKENESTVAARKKILETTQTHKGVPAYEDIPSVSARKQQQKRNREHFEQGRIENQNKKHESSNYGAANVIPSGASAIETSKNKNGDIEHGSKVSNSTVVSREPIQTSTENTKNDNDITDRKRPKGNPIGSHRIGLKDRLDFINKYISGNRNDETPYGGNNAHSNNLKLVRKDIRRNASSRSVPLRSNVQGSSKNQIKEVVKKPTKANGILPIPIPNTEKVTNKPELFDGRYNMSIFNDLNGLKSQDITITDLNTFTIPKNHSSLPEQRNIQLETKNIQAVNARENNRIDSDITEPISNPIIPFPRGSKIHVRGVVRKRLPISNDVKHTPYVYLAKNMCRICPFDSDSDSDNQSENPTSKQISKSAVSSTPLVKNDIHNSLETISKEHNQLHRQPSILKGGDKIGNKEEIKNNISNNDLAQEALSSTNLLPENTNIGENSVIKKRVRFIDPQEDNKKRKIEVRKKIYDKQNEILAKIGRPSLPVPDDLAHLYPQRSTNPGNINAIDPEVPKAKETIGDPQIFANPSNVHVMESKDPKAKEITGNPQRYTNPSNIDFRELKDPRAKEITKYPQISTNPSNVNITEFKDPRAKETTRDYKNKIHDEGYLDHSKVRPNISNNYQEGNVQHKLIGSPDLFQNERKRRENQYYNTDMNISSRWNQKDSYSSNNSANNGFQKSKIPYNNLYGQRNYTDSPSDEHSRINDSFQYQSPSLRYVRGEWSGRSRPSISRNNFSNGSDSYMGFNKSSRYLFDNNKSSGPSVTPRKNALPTKSKPTVTQPKKMGPPQLERVIVQMEPYSEKGKTTSQSSQISQYNRVKEGYLEKGETLSHTSKPPNTNWQLPSTSTANKRRIPLNISDMLEDKPSPEITTNPLGLRQMDYKSSDSSHYNGNNNKPQRHILPVITRDNNTDRKSSDLAGAVLLSFDEKSSSEEDTPLVKRIRKKSPGKNN